jgi:hypothetical protein
MPLQAFFLLSKKMLNESSISGLSIILGKTVIDLAFTG